MGNPGIKEPINCCSLSLNMYAMDSSLLPTGVITDYREYILQMLPNLEYLDGIARGALTNNCQHPIVNGGSSTSSSPSCSSRGNDGSSSQSHQGGYRKISPSLSFKDLFRLNRRKKSYPSSSTNWTWSAMEKFSQRLMTSSSQPLAYRIANTTTLLCFTLQKSTFK